MNKPGIFFALVLLLAGLMSRGVGFAAERIVTVSPAATETVFALGGGNQVVGVDTTSLYPPEAQELPKLGFHRQLSAEGILSLNPTIVICTDQSGPETVLRQIEDAGVRVERLASGHDVADAQARIARIGEILGQPEAARNLIARMQAQVEAIQKLLVHGPTPLSVLFIYARGGGTLNVSGTGTAADAMIRLAGGRNAVTGYEGYKPLTSEAVVTAAPDVLLLTTHGLEEMGGVDGLLKVPGLAHTPAAKNQRILALDDLLLLGFGPRLGEAVTELAKALYCPVPSHPTPAAP